MEPIIVQKIKLVFPSNQYLEKLEDFRKEFFDAGSLPINGSHSLNKAEDVSEWIKIANDRRNGVNLPEGRVPSSLYLAVTKKEEHIVGIVDIRHEVNDFILNYGGHIRYSIRPSERNKGYASKIFRLSLEKARTEIHLKKVLVTCLKTNTGLEKVILKFGGKLENEVINPAKKTVFRRYWFELNKKESKEPKIKTNKY